ncbi:MAG: DUF3332 domain-containing protein [Tannerellaceae bacterium]|nr:DUF3332 domain-containing protein [Tannerellaceae bacterium]
MKNKNIAFSMAIITTISLLFTSCIGSFGLTNKLLKWNKEIDSKFVNELVFVAFHIIPVYPVSFIADLLVINSIEFWSGENPVSDTVSVNKIETENGVYLVETTSTGYTITKEGEELSLYLLFEQNENRWDMEYDGVRQKLFKHIPEDRVVMFLPDGSETIVSLDNTGLIAFRQQTNLAGYYASH